MGTNKGTNSRAGAGDRSNNQSNKGTKAVKKAIGFTEKKAGPFDYLQKGKTTGTYAVTNGKTNDMYGGAASKATDDYLVSQGKVKVGNYFKKVGGNFVRISKEEGEKLYAKGDPSISRSTIGNTKSQELKYGQSNSAMGSGDPTGIMTSIQISEPMFQSQKKVQNIALGAMAIMGVPLTGTAFAYNNRPSNSYDNYLKKFYSTMSSSGIQSSQKTNQTTDNVVSNQDQVVDQTTQEKDIVTTSKFKKKKASQGDDQLASARSLFKKTGQTITGSMV
tara:strand:- start:105 stop:932 length:828 start_codon:yes stop_codon:yes gene_type:complete